MRLLNTTTLQLENFTDERSAPPYGILSHTWEQDEVLFDDIENWASSGWAKKQGAQKVRQSAEQARSDSLDYIWIDTLCIDKSSSAELSEAINSMFNWYGRSAVCYAYLFDVPDEGSGIQGCKWLTRGWTLQELIAPDRVYFYDRHWRFLGTRNSLAEYLGQITGIDHVLLYNYQDLNDGGLGGSLKRMAHRRRMPQQSTLASISVASRMFWASKRKTTRSEDVAYCLMGLFNVNMPLLYGEGDKAFARLQREILKVSTDTSILAFVANRYSTPIGMLAPSPANFALSLPAVWEWKAERPRMLLENDRISMDAILCATSACIGSGSDAAFWSEDSSEDDEMGEKPCFFYLVLDGSFNEDHLARPAILVRHEHDSIYRRVHYGVLYCVHTGTPRKSNPRIAAHINKHDRTRQSYKALLTVIPESARREHITLVASLLRETRLQSRPALYLMDTTALSLPKDGVACHVTNSRPPLRDNVAIHPLSPLSSYRDLCSDGYLSLSLEGTNGNNVSTATKELLIVSWGSESRTEPKSRPWCKIWTMGELDLKRWLRVDLTVPESKIEAVFTRSDGGLRWNLIPQEGREQPADTVLILNHSATPPTQHRFTVSVKSATFLERTTLQMRMEINKITPVGVGAELFRERRVILKN